MSCDPEAEFLDVIGIKVLKSFSPCYLESPLLNGAVHCVHVLIVRDGLNDLHTLVKGDNVHGVPNLIESQRQMFWMVYSNSAI
jgi:hypothetical protein